MYVYMYVRICVCIYVVIFPHIENQPCSLGYVRQVAAIADFMKQSSCTYIAVDITTSDSIFQHYGVDNQTVISGL